MRIFPSIVLVLAFFNLPSAFAADYSDDATGLVFRYSDQYGLRNFTESYNAGKADPAKVDSYFLIGPEVSTSGRGVFEILQTEQVPSDVLEQVQLRFINTERRENRDIMGQTGVELIGSSHLDGAPRHALVFAVKTKTLAIIYSGSDVAEYEDFLASVQDSNDFADIVGHPLRSEINDAAKRGIFSGSKNPLTDRPEFHPDRGINRAEFIKVLVLSASEVTNEMIEGFKVKMNPPEERAGNKDEGLKEFLDVNLSDWFAPYLYYAKYQGWITGYPDGSFKPGNPVTLAEAAKVIVNSRQVQLSEDPELWFRPALDYLVDQSAFYQFAEQYRFTPHSQLLNPSSDVTRGHVAALLSRLLKGKGL